VRYVEVEQDAGGVGSDVAVVAAVAGCAVAGVADSVASQMTAIDTHTHLSQQLRLFGLDEFIETVLRENGTCMCVCVCVCILWECVCECV